VRCSPLTLQANATKRSTSQTSSQHHSSRSIERRGENGSSAVISQGQGRHGGTIHNKDHLVHPSRRAPRGEEVVKLQFQYPCHPILPYSQDS
jgi:hypothetical protein